MKAGALALALGAAALAVAVTRRGDGGEGGRPPLSITLSTLPQAPAPHISVALPSITLPTTAPTPDLAAPLAQLTEAVRAIPERVAQAVPVPQAPQRAQEAAQRAAEGAREAMERATGAAQQAAQRVYPTVQEALARALAAGESLRPPRDVFEGIDLGAPLQRAREAAERLRDGLLPELPGVQEVIDWTNDAVGSLPWWANPFRVGALLGERTREAVREALERLPLGIAASIVGR